MGRYKVKESRAVIDGTVYTKGQTVTSPLPLDELFVNKFEKAQGGEDDMPEGEPPTVQNPSSKKKKTLDAPRQKDVGRKARPEEVEREPTPQEREEEVSEAAGGEESEAAQEEESVDRGADVTDQFPTAGEADLLVYQTENGFDLYDKDDPEKVIQSFRTKTDVNKHLRSLRGR